MGKLEKIHVIEEHWFIEQCQIHRAGIKIRPVNFIIKFRPGLDKNIEMMDSQLGMLKRKIDFNQNTIYQQEVEMGREISNVGL